MSQRGFNEGVSNTQPSDTCVSITDNEATHKECRAVSIGVSQSIDLYVYNALPAGPKADQASGWVTFKGATAGTILPVMARGARKTAATAAPDADDIVFIY